MRMVSADGRGFAAKKAAPQKAASGPAERPKLWLTVSYVLLVVGGYVGLHRLYNRQPIIAFAQALFSVYIFLNFGSMISLYLAILLLAWLISDAVAIPKWTAQWCSDGA
jgi:TM2 domain-containing membrane protein YozV